MHNAQHRSKPQTQRPLLKVLFLSLSSVPTPGMVSGTWGRAATGCWVAGLTSVYARSASTVHSVGQRTCWDSPTLFPLLPWPLGSASPSPRVGEEQAFLPSCRTASTAPAPKAWLTQPLLAPSFFLQIIFASFSLE